MINNRSLFVFAATMLIILGVEWLFTDGPSHDSVQRVIGGLVAVVAIAVIGWLNAKQEERRR